MENNMITIFNRTMENCEFYKRNGKEAHLLNEIGVLRGVAYCIEASVGEYDLPNADRFYALIAEQVQMLKAAEQTRLEAAAELMDDEIREDIHNSGKFDGDPAAFLREYERRHFEKFGEKFSV